MIFPHLHQLDAVLKLIAHVSEHGAGLNSLISHSASSGKSNSIAWTVYRLALLHDKDNKYTLTGKGEVGRTLEEGVEISRLLESYSYDYLNTDMGTYDSFYYACPPMHNPHGFTIPLTVATKKSVSIPVMAGGRMQDYDLAAKAIEASEIDTVNLGCPSLADKEYPNKVICREPSGRRGAGGRAEAPARATRRSSSSVARWRPWRWRAPRRYAAIP